MTTNNPQSTLPYKILPQYLRFKISNHVVLKSGKVGEIIEIDSTGYRYLVDFGLHEKWVEWSELERDST